ncbi:diguanylate cyclase domain-containing protein [Laribacter hongkongensis]|uniref:diguanylate cyclase domain-containing protein n=1 Tax=Laribacter hongkongensis TaxID=168471 RepID=UPI000412098F|nr:diguanylate cyclase [Laribacter hongkongensis]
MLNGDFQLIANPLACLDFLFNKSHDLIIVVDANKKVVAFNKASEQFITAIEKNGFFDDFAINILDDECAPSELKFSCLFDRALEGEAIVAQCRIADIDIYSIFLMEMRRIDNEIQNVILKIKDISSQYHDQLVAQSHRKLLDQLSKGEDLPLTLKAIVNETEKHGADIFVSILLFDEDRQSLHLGAAPSLPDFYNSAIEGLIVGEGIGSCGTAAFTGKRVVVEDVMIHPFWKDFRALAQRADLRSCWSEPILSRSGKILGTFAVYRRVPYLPTNTHIDIIERAAKLAAIAIESSVLNEELKLADLVYRNCQESIVVTDRDGFILNVNPAFCFITKFSRKQSIGSHFFSLLSISKTDVLYFDTLGCESESDYKYTQMECVVRARDGQTFPAEVKISSVLDDNEVPWRHIYIFSDQSYKKAAEELIWKQAHLDSLTGLLNRYGFMSRLNSKLEKIPGDNGEIALLFIDLDGFKEVNDSFGHAAGDTLLKVVGERISGCVRSNDLVSRLGGDEFTVLLSFDFPNNCHRTIERIGNEILNEIRLPVLLDFVTVKISASIGVSRFPSDALNGDDLLRIADMAMYLAKKNGKNSLFFYKSTS